MAISVGSTAVGVLGLAAINPRGGRLSAALLLTGLFIGPSTGYWYADSPRWKKGIAVRSIALGVGALGAAGATQCGVIGPDKPQCDVGAIVVLAAGVTVLVTDILDVVDLPRAVREANGAAPRVALRPAGAGIAINVSS